MSGSDETARMSMAAWHISVKFRLASRETFWYPVAPPPRYPAAKPAASAILAISGFRTSGAVTGSGPCIMARSDIGRFSRLTASARGGPAAAAREAPRVPCGGAQGPPRYRPRRGPGAAVAQAVGAGGVGVEGPRDPRGDPGGDG